MNFETVDRLLLSRSLVAPLRFTPASDRFVVALHVLAAHDAAELAIAAICAARKIPVPDNKPLSLPDYLGKIREHLHPNRDAHARDYISMLNRVRVDLKHHGITPDKEQWGRVAELIFDHISSWCREYLNVDYVGLDAVDLIGSDDVRDLVKAARRCLESGEFRLCLERLAESIETAKFSLFPIGLHLVVGQADADAALTLTGYGIDPGRFIALQRLLPPSGAVFGYEPSWEKLKYGHSGNWTQENIEFAYAETVNLLTRLQQATPYPMPSLYHDVFRDVLIVNRDLPEVTVLFWSLDGWYEPNGYSIEFVTGDSIKCRAVGSHSVLVDPNDSDNWSLDPEKAEFVVATSVESDKVKVEGVDAILIFRRTDVDIMKEPLYEEESG